MCLSQALHGVVCAGRDNEYKEGISNADDCCEFFLPGGMYRDALISADPGVKIFFILFLNSVDEILPKNLHSG